MNALSLFASVAGGIAVIGLLFGGTFLLLFMERLVYARVQHREGPGRGGQVDYFQVWKDYQKTKAKERASDSLSLRFRASTFAWRLLPGIFLLVLLGGILPETAADTEVPFLLLLPLVAATLEAFFLHASHDSRERYEWRRRMLLRVMSGSVIALSFLAVAIRAGGLSLDAVSRLQDVFPFHALLSSPGLLACGLAAFGAICLFPGDSAGSAGEGLSLTRSMHYMIFFVRKMWVLCLLSFWVFVFLGGLGGGVAKLLFPLKVVGMLFIFTLLQGSFPRIRSSDAAELATRWLFRLCFVGILAEAVWLGVWG